jgi:hypothetical protein
MINKFLIYYFIYIIIILLNSLEFKKYVEYNYVNKINKICPFELTDNYAGKDGLYFNTTDSKIKKSLEHKYFHHCGAWCLFDYDDPRNGWYWNSTFRIWDYYKDIYLICPQDEFHYVLDKFLIRKNIF